MLTLPKDRLLGDAVTEELEVPVPDRGTCCGLLLAVSVKFKVAVRVPLAVGLKKTFTVQLAPAASEEPQGVEVDDLRKSPALVPVMPMLLIVIALLPVLVRVTTFAPLVFPTATVFQTREVGETVACAEAARPDSRAHVGMRPMMIVRISILKGKWLIFGGEGREFQQLGRFIEASDGMR